MAITDAVDPYEFLASRGANVNTARLDKEFASRLAKALMAAEAATGQRGSLSDAYRDPKRQAQYYANYKQKPVDWDGVTYTPQRQGGLAAPPGRSRHQHGAAADIPRGAVLDWLHKNAGEHGLEFLTGSAFEADPVHIQMAGSGSVKHPFLSAGDTEEPGLLQPAINVAKQMGAGAVDLAASAPWALMALPTAGVELIGKKLGELVDYEYTMPGTRYLLERTLAGSEVANKLTGAENPKNMAEKIARAGPSAALIPGGALPRAAITTAGTVLPELLAPDEAHADIGSATGKMINDAITVEGTNGPEVVPTPDYTALGTLGLATIGMIFAPGVYNKLKTAKFMQPILPQRVERPVANAAPGTMAIDDLDDLARTYDDVHAGVLRTAKGAGVPLDVVQSLQDTFRIQTRAAGHGLADNAVTAGRFDTPTVSFKVPVSLDRLNSTSNAQVNEYLHLRALFDEMQQLQKLRPHKGVPPRSTIHGLDEAAVLRQITALERANPQLKQFAVAYGQNLKEARRVAASGEYGILSKQDVAKLNAERPNEIMGYKRNMDDAIPLNVSPFEVTGDTMHRMIRKRLENEAIGRYVDAMKAVNPKLFRQVSPKQLHDNPQWRRNIVSFRRRGKIEHYTTSEFFADTLKIDPYYFIAPPGFLYGTKRALEMTTTGALAPWFAPTSALRSFQIGRMTKGDLKPPSVTGSLVAIPEQVLLPLAKAVGERLDSSGWIKSVLGQPFVDAISRRLVSTYDNSLLAQMEHYGSHRGAYMAQQMDAVNRRFSDFMKSGPVYGTDQLYNLSQGYMKLLNAVHNAPAFSFAKRNRRRLPIDKLVLAARHMTGDPRVGGEFLNQRGRPIRSSAGSAAGRGVTQTYGALTQFGREAVPWYNYTVQGMKRMGEAYLKNPAAFTGRLWLYSMMPAAGLYFYNKALGPEYVDHMMHRRGNYNSTMSYYFGLFGRPPEEGIEFPRFHEAAGSARLMETVLHHIFGNSMFSQQEDYAALARNWLSVTMMPPTPPLIGAAFGAAGQQLPQGGLMGGETYPIRKEPFNQYTPFNENIEAMTRQLGGGLADVLGHMYTTMSMSEADMIETVKIGLKAGAKRVAEKTPIVRDLTGHQLPVSGDTRISQELFKKNTALRALNDFYSKWSKEPSSGSNAGAPGEINTKAASKGGQQIVDFYLGEGPPTQSLGLNQPNPTNPLYAMFAKAVYDKFQKEAPPMTEKDEAIFTTTPNISGDSEPSGMGFQSMWRRFGDYGEHLRRLKNVNDGNAVSWRRYIEAQPELMEYLKKNGVSHTEPKKVRNFLEKKRQEVGSFILQVIRQVEAEFSELAGRPIRIEDLSPYSGQLPVQSESEEQVEELDDQVESVPSDY